MSNTLAKQATVYGFPWSLERDNQLRALLESGLDAAVGCGLTAGGILRKAAVGAFSVTVPAGTEFFQEGALYTLAADLDFGPLDASAKVWVWATITRTPADPDDRANLDTYTVAVSKNLTGVAPSALHVPLAIVWTDASGIYDWDNAPAGKYLPVAQAIQTNASTIAAGAAGIIPSGRQAVLSGDVTINGELTVDGTLHILGEEA